MNLSLAIEEYSLVVVPEAANGVDSLRRATFRWVSKPSDLVGLELPGAGDLDEVRRPQ